MLRCNVETACWECREPLQIGQLIRKFGRPQRFIHNACYVPKTPKEPRQQRKNWDIHVDVPLTVKLTRNHYLCPKCGSVSARIYRRDKFIVKMVCSKCGEPITKRFLIKRHMFGACAFCGKPKTNRTLARYNGCCSNVCRRKLQAQEVKPILLT
jgi:predicted RNA-binding Zn-ribbon protein involved in translation (DUF1610 family)